MKLIETLVTKVKPELNHIYTEMPFLVHGGRDMGWFCREHALHLYGLAVLMHKQANIITGDYILRLPGRDFFRSVGDESDHAWCRIDDCIPVDVSITVKHVYPDVPDISLVYGDHSDMCEPFEVKYYINEPDDAFLELGQYDKPLVAYNEKNRHRYSVSDLLADPFQFLHKPPPGSRTFLEIHGPEVFFAITYHCYRLATEDIKPFCRYRNPSDTVKGIMKFNPNAKNLIQKLLA